MEDTINIQEEKKEVDRLKTGIKGLDDKIEGGFPKGSTIVVTGTPGTGKSIFAMGYIAQGCKNGEKCLYLTVEQTPDEIADQAMQFNWDYNQWENEGLLKFVHLNFRKLSEMKTYDELERQIEENHYDRMVIDSTTSISDSPLTPYSLADGADRGLHPSALTMMNRANVLALFEVTKKHGVTTVCISQKVEGKPGDTLDNISEFIGDGLILLERKLIGKTSNRIVEIKKLRKTKIDDVPHNFEFINEGIALK
jgi:KaiC/GvpD/RAD55 family RecA-like ATPase